MNAEHLIRTVAVAVVALAAFGAWLYLSATGADPALVSKLEGGLMVLAPAVADTLRVARKQRRDSVPPPR